MGKTRGQGFDLVIRSIESSQAFEIPDFFGKESELISCKKNILFIKFHYWNLSGYSDLSVKEGIVGRRERICVK